MDLIGKEEEEGGSVVVVTGGRGFVARHLICMLLRSFTKWSTVRIVDLQPSIPLEPDEDSGILSEALRSGRAIYLPADLRHKPQVISACQGASVVFHMAAPDSSINNYQLHYSVNVQGTKNVIDACVECKVKKLIFTSSASVVFDGFHGILDGDESLPYAKEHNCSYSATKAEAESSVLQANGTGGLLTCSLRPGGIFGPGDKLFVPHIVSTARSNIPQVIIGDGNNMFDFVYVENVAHAHICAERALGSEAVGEETVAGKAFFVTNMEPIKLWEFLSLLLEGLGYERPKVHIPVFLVMPIAYVVDWTYKLLGPHGMPVPQMTPSRIKLVTCDQTFNCSAAKELLGYSPIVSLKDGIEMTCNSFSHLRAKPTNRKRDGLMKSTGKHLEGTLWKYKKQIFGIVTLLPAACYSFSSADTIIASIFLMMLFLLVNSMFLDCISNSCDEKYSADSGVDCLEAISKSETEHTELGDTSNFETASNGLSTGS